ncbi:Metallo-beta-lactamase superfamily domain protein in prophage [Planococcus halocryophilus Or1]|uniref:MBL fold metallo-hydrolase n=1 Tax=Planococcus halocryophilus TaxID=1215089 RepID=A0A1C7DQ64_9BACL|nr:MBL fold metallo-hydrolase [Planococcus halocryophilus]ANU13488.1 MBL fold metallo-hydrolase [Planococcus halocryophilus]EMF46297.1 Metallo-beta-lactamase superfamily domain protein in prophage [Planococcus halocryophilus Or1]
MIEIKTLATGSKGNCYYITDGYTPLLLEAGIKFRDIQRKLNFQTRDIKGCLITHEHKDHCMGVPDVLKAGITCYLSKGTKDELGIEHHRLKVVENKKQFQIGTWTILPFDVQHDVSEPFGFLLVNSAGDKLLFATDTYYIKYRFKDITHLMVECNYSQKILDENILSGRTPKVLRKRLMRSHFSLENVKEFLKANDLSKLQEIWLLHLSDSNSNEEQFRQEVAELTGKMIYIP